jgi:hypothetical protein
LILQRNSKAKLLIKAVKAVAVADQKVTRLVRAWFRRERFEGYLGADAGRITERNADLHLCFWFG